MQAFLAVLLLLPCGFSEVLEGMDQPGGALVRTPEQERAAGRHQRTLQLEHAFGSNGGFEYAGEISYAFVETKGRSARPSGSPKVLHTFQEGDAQRMQEVVDKADRFYIRVREEDGRQPTAWAPASCLAMANLREHIALHLDAKGGVEAVEIAPATGECSSEKAVQGGRVDSAAQPRPTTTVKTAKEPPRLDPEVARDFSSSTTNPQPKSSKKNKSFLQKYWMYIIPVAVLLLQSAQNPPQQGGQAQGQGSQ